MSADTPLVHWEGIEVNAYTIGSLWLWLLLIACQAQDNTEHYHWEGEDTKPSPAISVAAEGDADARARLPENPEQDKADEGEKVSPPMPVSGIFLAASIAEEGPDYLVLGLRGFVGEQRVSQLPETTSVQWSIQTSSTQNSLVGSIELTKDPSFDVYFVLKGGAVEDLKRELAAFDVQLQVTDGSASKSAQTKTFNIAELLQE